MKYSRNLSLHLFESPVRKVFSEFFDVKIFSREHELEDSCSFDRLLALLLELEGDICLLHGLGRLAR
jgi:hypothetical protein